MRLCDLGVRDARVMIEGNASTTLEASKNARDLKNYIKTLIEHLLLLVGGPRYIA